MLPEELDGGRTVGGCTGEPVGVLVVPHEGMAPHGHPVVFGEVDEAIRRLEIERVGVGAEVIPLHRVLGGDGVELCGERGLIVRFQQECVVVDRRADPEVVACSQPTQRRRVGIHGSSDALNGVLAAREGRGDRDRNDAREGHSEELRRECLDDHAQ